MEAFRKRGVDAEGIDISEYAIQNVHPEIKDHCKVQSVTSPLSRHYDLIVCIEVLEHLLAADAEQAVANFCRSCDRVLFSSTPSDFNEATHFNVRQPEYWAELFATHGFYRDVEYNSSYITAWTAMFCKNAVTLPRVVSRYERRYWQLIQEILGVRQTTLSQREQLEYLVRETGAKDAAVYSSKREAEEQAKELAKAKAREAAYLKQISALEQRLQEAYFTDRGAQRSEPSAVRPDVIREVLVTPEGSFAWAITRRCRACAGNWPPKVRGALTGFACVRGVYGCGGAKAPARCVAAPPPR